MALDDGARAWVQGTAHVTPSTYLTGVTMNGYGDVGSTDGSTEQDFVGFLCGGWGGAGVPLAGAQACAELGGNREG